jgi:4,4'-diaponeurosporenoate glycosyltransferase
VAIRLGGDQVRFRMYPAGVAQLVEGWTKNMAIGAGAVPLHRSLAVFWWIAGAGSAAMSLGFVPGNDGVDPWVGVALYGGFVVQLLAIARQIGTFRAAGIALYPVALVAFIALFVRSTWRLRVRRSVRWRGRTIPLGGAGPAT